ncbi:MAG: hypothetical protein PSX36_11155 [bacterium]|nr:hypothetical protein [bacterium]
MGKCLFFALLFATFILPAQTKKSAPKDAPVIPQADPLKTDSLVEEEEADLVIRDFKVYTKRSKSKKEKMKLCLNLVSGDSILNYCINDSLLRDPEFTKVLFQERSADSTYMLVYVSAFSKAPDKPECTAGKETKLFFVRWNTQTGKAIVKQRSIESCMRGITNMTIDPILNWAGQSTLVVSYHKGGTTFSELRFDPQNYRLGLQTISD